MSKKCGSENMCNCHCESSVVAGNAIDIKIDNCHSEIRADILVEEYKSVRLWGQVINCNGYSVPGALVKLLKVVKCHDGWMYRGIAHTVSDCEGFYQFDVCADECEDYKIIVSKPDYGPERVEENIGGVCNPCEECNPCKEYEPEPCEPPKKGKQPKSPYKEYPPVDDYYWKPEFDNGGCGCNK